MLLCNLRSGDEPSAAERAAHNAKARGLSSTVMAGADLEQFRAVAAKRQGRNVAKHVARDSSAYAEFLDDPEAASGATEHGKGPNRAKL